MIPARRGDTPFPTHESNRTMTQTHDTQQSSHPEPSGIPPFGGVVTAAVGAGIVLLAMVGHTAMPDWMRVVGVILGAMGVYIFLSGGLSRGHVLEWVRAAAMVLVILLPVQWALTQPFKIPSGSMEPTLHGTGNFLKDDRVLVNKWVYGLRVPFAKARLWEGKDPQRWDIVVFKAVEDEAAHGTLIKRVAALPGERVLIRGGKLFINGEPVPFPDGMPEDMYYTAHSGMRFGVHATPESMEVPEGCYLMLGDNSDNSRDGRYFGWVPKDNILGRVSCVWWPVWNWRDFTGFSRTWWGRLLLYGIPILLVAQEIWHFRRKKKQPETQ